MSFNFEVIILFILLIIMIIICYSIISSFKFNFPHSSDSSHQTEEEKNGKKKVINEKIYKNFNRYHTHHEQQQQHQQHEKYSIIGISCKFPQCENKSDFWKLLIEGKSAITTIPHDRWNISEWYSSKITRKGKMNMKKGGFLSDIDKFDSKFFNIGRNEADRMDPQQRILLECCYHCIEDSGLSIESFSGKNVGVFVGMSSYDYGVLSLQREAELEISGKTISGNTLCMSANRISYFLNIHGPSFIIDTACSSSLTALNCAINSIESGSCCMAFVGGVNLMINPETTLSFSKGEFLANDGLCKTFDNNANGYVRSEGCGMILIMKNQEAIREKMKIYCNVLSVNVNHNGKTNGLSQPNGKIQEQLINETYEKIGFLKENVQYVECHGTGTSIGDPIECNAIGNVIGKKKKKNEKLLIGSVKTNIGHLESGSGIAGIIKVALSMKNKIIPRNLHFNEPNKKIMFKEMNLQVVTNENYTWKGDKEGRLFASLNSFGFGGSNGHCLFGLNTKLSDLQQHPEGDKRSSSKKTSSIFLLSAKSKESLDKYCENYVSYLKDIIDDDETTIESVCSSTFKNKSDFNYRLSILVDSKGDLIEKLNQLIHKKEEKEEAKKDISSFLYGVNYSRIKKEIKKPEFCFVYSGQGPQWYAMGYELIQKEVIFRKCIEECDRELKKYDSKLSIFDELTKNDKKNSRINETRFAQPAIFSIQYAVTELLRIKFNIIPSCVIGHSIGEIGSFWVSGYLSFEDAIKLVYSRSYLQDKLRNKGLMIVVGLNEQKVYDDILSKYNLVNIAAVNGPSTTVLSGNSEQIKKIHDELTEKDVFNSILRVNVPFHSYYMDEIRDDLLDSLKDISFKRGKSDVLLYSSVTGKLFNNPEINFGEYWMGNIRGKVEFLKCMKRIIEKEGYKQFIEISPHPIMQRYVEKIMSKDSIIVSTLSRKYDDERNIYNSIGKLYTYGDKLNLFSNDKYLLDLPLYPFKKEKCWFNKKPRGVIRYKYSHPLIKDYHRISNTKHLFNIDLNDIRHPFIEDHKLQNEVVFPGAGFCELLLNCGMIAYPENFKCLKNISFEKVLFLESNNYDDKIMVYFDENHMRICKKDTVHVQGEIDYSITTPSPSNDKTTKITTTTSKSTLFDEILLKKNDWKEINFSKLYENFDLAGLNLSNGFRNVQKVWNNEITGECFGYTTIHERIADEVCLYKLHPCILDCLFQVMFGFFGEKYVGVYVPISISKFKFHQPLNLTNGNDEKIYSYGKMNKELSCNIWIFNDSGELCCEIEKLQIRYIEGTKNKGDEVSTNGINNLLFNWKWSNSSHKDKEEPVLKLPTIDRIELNDCDKEIPVDFIEELHNLMVNFNDDFLEVFQHFAVDLIKEFSFDDDSSDSKFVKYLTKTFQNHSIIDINGGKKHLLDEFHEKYFKQFPYETDLVFKSVNNMKKVLKGEIKGNQVLFEDDWDKIMNYYLHSTSFNVYNLAGVSVIEKIIQSIDNYDNQEIRILEIGAGTGGFSYKIFDLLSKLSNKNVKYVFSDISYSFLTKARSKFGVKYNFIEFEKVDISKIDESLLNKFDIIIASDVIHATEDIEISINNIHRYLKQNGVFIMLELTFETFSFVDVIFGITDGWWMFNDSTSLRKDKPTLDVDQWKTLLKKEFDYVDIAGSKIAVPQTLFVCQKTEERLKGKWLIFNNMGNDKTFNYLINKIDDYQVFDNFDSQYTEFDGIIYLSTRCSNHELLNTNEVRFDDEYNLVKLVQNYSSKISKLFVITSNVFQINEVDKTNEEISIKQGCIWGFSRSLIHEYPKIKVNLIDLSSNSNMDVLYQSLISNKELEIAIRNDTIYNHQLIPSVFKDICYREKDYFKAVIREKGNLETIEFEKFEEFEELKRCEIEINVKSVGLNFKDVVLSMNILKSEAIKNTFTKDSIGMECSGIITKCNNEGDLKVGDEVICIAPNSLSSFVKTRKEFVIKKPTNLSFNEAASIPMVYLTAYYSLITIGQLKRGEKVLIHSISGGVGLACIKICKEFDCEIFGTVGNKEKKDFLFEYGYIDDKDKIFVRSDPDDDDFDRKILEETNEKGVDIIINSLIGDYVPKNLKMLNSYGRLIELGKTDIYNDRRVGLRPFFNNISYFAVDIDKLLKDKPQLCNEILKRVINNYTFEPIIKVFTNPVDAFMYFVKTKHVGKIIVELKDKYEMVNTSLIERTYKKDAVYLIAGGTSGLGFEIVKNILMNGGKNVVIFSRNGVKCQNITNQINQLNELGKIIQVYKVDITDFSSLSEMFSSIKLSFPGISIKGIVNCVLNLADKMIANLDYDSLLVPILPKVIGSINLHKLSLNYDLDFFTSFSSLSSFYGSIGQANYAAANFFLESLSEYRNNIMGLTSNCIAYGLLDDVGFAYRNKNVFNILNNLGWKSIPLQKSLKAFNFNFEGVLGCIDANWGKITSQFSSIDKNSKRFEEIIIKYGNSYENDSVGKEDDKLSAIEQQEVTLNSITQMVIDQIKKISNENTIDLENSLIYYGFDSLMSNQLINWVEKQFLVSINLMKIMKGMTIKSILNTINEKKRNKFHAGSSTMKGEEGKWILTPKPIDEPSMRIICFPPMFSGPLQTFLGFEDYWIAENCEVCLINVPGKEQRINEIPIFNIKELVKQLSLKLLPYIQDVNKFIFYGHSLGAKLASEVINYLHQTYNIHPELFVVGAWKPPNVKFDFQFSEDDINVQNMHKIREELKRIGLSNESKILLNKELFPAVKFELLLSNYQEDSTSTSTSSVLFPSSMNLLVIAGKDDNIFSIDELREWKNYLLCDKNNKTDFNFKVIESNHMFIMSEKKEVYKMIKECIVV